MRGLLLAIASCALLAACQFDERARAGDGTLSDGGAGAAGDAGAIDADADVGRDDAGGGVDASLPDAGSRDADPGDAGGDAGNPGDDAGSADAGSADAGDEDAGSTDAGDPDAGLCGDVDGPCCAAEPACAGEFIECTDGLCQECGAELQSCCETGDACRGLLVCITGVCVL